MMGGGNDSGEPEIRMVLEHLKALEGERDQVTKRNGDTQQSIRVLREELGKRQHELRVATDHNQQQTAELLRLRAVLNQIEATTAQRIQSASQKHASELSVLRGQCESLRTDRDRAQKRALDFEDQLRCLQAARPDSVLAAKQLREARGTEHRGLKLSGENAQLRAEVCRLQRQLRLVQEHGADADEVHALRQRLETARVDQVQQTTQLRRALEDEQQALRREADGSAAEVRRLRELLSERESELSRLRAAQGDTVPARQFEKAEADRVALAKQLDMVLNDVAARDQRWRADIEEHKLQLQDAHKQRLAVEGLRAEKGELQDSLHAAREEEARLNGEVQSALDRVSELKVQREEDSAARSRLEAEREALVAKVYGEAADRKHAEAELRRASEDLQQARSDADAAVLRAQRFESEAAAERKRADSAEERVEEEGRQRERRADKLRSELKDRKKALAAARNALQIREQEHADQARDCARQHEAELAACRRQAESEARRLEALQRETENAAAAVAREAQNRVEHLEEARRRGEERESAHLAELARRDLQIENLSASLRELREFVRQSVVEPSMRTVQAARQLGCTPP
eukprot:TRINITY_DN26549_c0_g1_i1.p1 TRINITY_DN26549_c0_g1~~TRINITY_DN26549_c0_g1_i1.p1  ORF type:complete len:605 (+),score=272.41 TRINITY_DN26549_c0_g1_i1:66-1817(+)